MKTQPAPNRPLNILFIMTDQHNPDYVGYMGRNKVATPHIDRLAEGTVFTNAVSQNPVCTPARCALLTGKYPHQVGMLTMSGDLSPQHPTYMQALRQAGYFTAGIGKFHWLQGWHWDTGRGKGHNLVELQEEMKKFGFDHIWEAAGKGLSLKNYCHYCEHLERKGLLEAYRNEIVRRGTIGHPEPADESPVPEEDHADVMIGSKIVEAIRNRPRGKPFCIFGSFLSPHPIIDPPRRYSAAVPLDENESFLQREGQKVPLTDELKKRWRENRRGYKALIQLVDDQIGKIFATLEQEGILDETVIIFTSDHGDMLGNFGIDGKNVPYRESASVPLAIRHPHWLTGQVVTEPVELIDVTATILDCAGLDPGRALALDWPAFHDIVPCRSLLPIIGGSGGGFREYVFSENGEWEMLQTSGWKYVRHRSSAVGFHPPAEELYHLTADPFELHNLAAEDGQKAKLAWFRARKEHLINSTPPAQIRWAPIMADKGEQGNYCGIAPYFPRKQPIALK